MKHIALRKLLVITLLTCSSTALWAQLSNVEGLNFKLGDDLNVVKKALQTSIEPEPVDSGSGIFNGVVTVRSVLFLRSKGIKVFFNKKDAVESIRIEPPFAGAVYGVKLGDTGTSLRSAKGKPVKAPWAYGSVQFSLYVLDDTAYIRFDTTDADGVQAITIQK